MVGDKGKETGHEEQDTEQKMTKTNWIENLETIIRQLNTVKKDQGGSKVEPRKTKGENNGEG